MRASIHRGADEVGGSCVEVESNSGDRLVLDLGLPLSADPSEEVALPTIEGLDGGDPTLRGVLVSHGHPDHYGLIGSISREVPLYMGEAASRILREASFFTPQANLQLWCTVVLVARSSFLERLTVPREGWRVRTLIGARILTPSSGVDHCHQEHCS